MKSLGAPRVSKPIVGGRNSKHNHSFALAVSNLNINQPRSNTEPAMVSTVTIFASSGIIKIDEVSFAPKSISDIRIEGGHPNGPVFAFNGARAVLSDEGANQLVAAGATDHR